MPSRTPAAGQVRAAGCVEVKRRPAMPAWTSALLAAAHSCNVDLSCCRPAASAVNSSKIAPPGLEGTTQVRQPGFCFGR